MDRDIYYKIHKIANKMNIKANFYRNRIISPGFFDNNTLQTICLYIVNKCNLNCAYCDNFSPLIKDEKIGKDDVLITFYRSYAHPQEGVLIYKIKYKNKVLVYATDKESYLGGDTKLTNFARNCDVLIHDAQYTTEDYLNNFVPKQGYGHSTFDMAVECAKQAGAKKLIFYHFDPGYDDKKLNSIKKHYENENAQLAYEGLEINLI